MHFWKWIPIYKSHFSAIWFDIAQALYLMYDFWIFYARMVDTSMTPIEGPGQYPVVELR